MYFDRTTAWIGSRWWRHPLGWLRLRTPVPLFLNLVLNCQTNGREDCRDGEKSDWPTPKSSSSSAFRLASYIQGTHGEIMGKTQKEQMHKTRTLTTFSGKFASCATWIPKLWSETPGSTLYRSVMSRSWLVLPVLVTCATTCRLVTWGICWSSAVNSWKCVANKQKARISEAIFLVHDEVSRRWAGFV